MFEKVKNLKDKAVEKAKAKIEETKTWWNNGGKEETIEGAAAFGIGAVIGLINFAFAEFGYEHGVKVGVKTAVDNLENTWEYQTMRRLADYGGTRILEDDVSVEDFEAGVNSEEWGAFALVTSVEDSDKPKDAKVTGYVIKDDEGRIIKAKY